MQRWRGPLFQTCELRRRGIHPHSCPEETVKKILDVECNAALKVFARDFVVPVIEQGVWDGSIATRFPKELGETVRLF